MKAMGCCGTRIVGPYRMVYGNDTDTSCDVLLYRGQKQQRVVTLRDDNPKRNQILEHVKSGTYCDIKLRGCSTLLSVTPSAMALILTVKSVVPTLKPGKTYKVLTKERGVIYTNGYLETGFVYTVSYHYDMKGRIVLDKIIGKRGT